MGLTTRERFQQLTDDEIIENIKSREELLTQMVGNLYPGIVQDEITVLKEIQSERTSTNQNNWSN